MEFAEVIKMYAGYGALGLCLVYFIWKDIKHSNQNITTDNFILNEFSGALNKISLALNNINDRLGILEERNK